MPDENNTFGLNNSNSISPEPLSPAQPSASDTPVTPQEPTLTQPIVTPDQTLDIDKELEKQLAQTPDTSTSGKKFPVKIVAIIIAVILIGGAAAAYFLMKDSAPSSDTADEQPPSLTNPFASKDTDNSAEEVTEEIVEEPSSETETPSEPPSLGLPSVAPEEDTAATDLSETVDTLKETTDAAANITDTPTIDDTSSADSTEDSSQKKISR